MVDTVYVDAELPVSSRRDHGVDPIGPTRRDYGWQAPAGYGFTAAVDLDFDWDGCRATCPEGWESSGWTPAVEGGKQRPCTSSSRGWTARPARPDRGARGHRGGR
jgi:transposase